MRTAVFALVMMWCVLTANSLSMSATGPVNEITFNSSDNGLIWPLPDPNDPTSVFAHAVHCKHILTMGHNTTDLDKMQIQHCKPVLKNVVRNAAVDVSKSVCNTLFGLNPEYYQMRAYNFWWDDHSSYDVLDMVNTGAILSNGTSTLSKLAGYNYKSLLMKEYYKDPKDPLTDKEREYLGSWFKPATLHLSAIAHTCQEQYGIDIYGIEGYYKTEDEKLSYYTGYWQLSQGFAWCSKPCKCDLTASGSAPSEITIQLFVDESSCSESPSCICQGVSGTLLGVVSGSQFSGHFLSSPCSGPVQPDQIILNCETPNPSIMVFNLKN